MPKYAFAEVPHILECSCVTGGFSMLLKVAFKSTMELDMFIGQLQKFGRTSTNRIFHAGWPQRGGCGRNLVQVQSTFVLLSHMV